MNLERISTLIGEEQLNEIRKLNILIIGIGGVGGYALESLVRMGINNITIIDYDIIDSSNLNRQIITNINNIGNKKVDEAYKRYININKDLNLNCLSIKIDEDSILKINFKLYDYIIDACDDIKAKVLIINEAINNNIKIISSMGTAKKLDASKLYTTTLDKTSYDHLAKKLRKLIDKKIQKKITVVSSKEESIKIDKLGSTSYVPAIAGLLITNYIINDKIKK